MNGLLSVILFYSAFVIGVFLFRLWQRQKNRYLKIQFYVTIFALAGAVWAMAYGEGHFIDWLTLGMCFGAVLVIERDPLLAFVSMCYFALMHEAVYFYAGVAPYVLFFHHTSPFFTTWIVSLQYNIIPVVATLGALIYFYRPSAKRVIIPIVIYATFTLLWLSQGFPYTYGEFNAPSVILTIPHSAAYWWEVGSSYAWLLSFVSATVIWRIRK